MQMTRKRTATATQVNKAKKPKVDPAVQLSDVKRTIKKKMVKPEKSDKPDSKTSPDFSTLTFKAGKKKTFKSKQPSSGKATPSTQKTTEGTQETRKGLRSGKPGRKITPKGKQQEQKESKPLMERIELPTTAEEMTCNWTKLQQMLGAPATGKKKPVQWRKRPLKTTQARTEAESGPDIWFDGVDDILIDTLKKNSELSRGDKTNPLIKQSQFTGLTKVVAMDCEMVGVGDGQDSILARVSIVNHDGHALYDKYVKPREKVTDYRTFVSGVRPEDLVNAHDFEVVQKEVSEILHNRILVGHALHNDLKVLFLSHPRKDTRDTARFKPFRRLSGGRTPGLKKLAKELLGVEVQTGEHSSVQDAQAAMRIYTMHRKEWEKHIKEMRRGKSRKKREPTSSTTDT